MSFLGTLFGGRTKREKRQDSAFESAFLPIVQQGAAYGKEYHDLAAPTLKSATDTLAKPTDYFSKILGGGPEMYNALSPELTGESTAYKNISAGSEFAPRGSGQVSRQGQLDTTHLQNISNIISKARPEAANSLTSISSLLANIGLGEAGASTGSAGTIGSLLQNWKNTNLEERKFRTQQLNQMMSEIGGFIGGL